MFYTVAGSVARMRAQIDEMSAIAELPDDELSHRHEAVSRWSPGEHLDHILKVSSSIVGLLLAGDAPALPRGISLIGRTILTLGWIPRGRGRSPEKMRAAQTSREDLQGRLTDLEALVARLSIDEIRNSRIPIVKHPYFGGLTRAEGARFNAVHTAHHLHIVRDVRRRQ